MPKKIQLTAVPEKELKKITGLAAVTVVETKWPKKESNAAEAKNALKTFHAKQPAAKPLKNPEIPVRAVEPTAATLSKLAAVVNSEAAPAEMLAQQFDDKALVGTIYSAIVTHEYMQMESEFKRRIASAGTRKQAEAQWPEVKKHFQKAFAVAGLSGVTEEKLSGYAQKLAANKENLNAVTKIANSAVLGQGPGDGKVPTAVRATFVPAAATEIDLLPLTIPIPNICAGPLVQGSFTKHFSYSFSLTVSLYVPCPTWTNPFRWCWKTFTIASVTFSLAINVGYKVNCCGASVWGQAAVQACASIIGFTVCASCVGTIVAVAGIAKTPVGGGKCTYGLGIVASLKCSFQGNTLFSKSVTFGYAITGPCPPAILPC
jgi:hypothetical protein